MNFFLEKQLIKFSCTYQPLSFCKIFKKFQSYEDVPFSGPKWPICPEQNFFGTNHYYYFHLPIGLFHCAKFKKILTVIQSCEDVPFLRSNFCVHLPQTKFLFFGKLLISFSSTYQPPSLCKILKKFLRQIQSYEDVQFSNEIFFRKPGNEPCFFLSYLSACEKSKSDINLLVKY